MKSKTYPNMAIADTGRYALALEKNFTGIKAVEYERTSKILTIHYEENAVELTEDQVKNVQVPIILKFRKKVTLPKLDAAAVVSATENEIVIETFDPETAREEVKQKLQEFEESK